MAKLFDINKDVELSDEFKLLYEAIIELKAGQEAMVELFVERTVKSKKMRPNIVDDFYIYRDDIRPDLIYEFEELVRTAENKRREKLINKDDEEPGGAA